MEGWWGGVWQWRVDCDMYVGSIGDRLRPPSSEQRRRRVRVA